MAALQIEQIPCLQDNYGYLIHDPVAGLTASIDTPDAAAIERALAAHGWGLDFILNTHHHFDHAGGNLALKAKTGCVIVGSRNDAARIPGIDVLVGEGDTFDFGEHRARILETPGHTTGHICYVFDDDNAAFVGDTLFSMGCGRLFEGTPEQMWASLQKLMGLPDDMRVYCAHEYTQSNGRFAVTMEPENAELAARIREVAMLRAAGRPTVPSTIGIEKATNPFLRPASTALRATLKLPDAADAEVLGETRRRKDRF
ncbi:MAG: hydroxyacylglutathione hydrolase [Gammaproteobacteria bacterium]|nr:hydroxyacylglutathione hydrolase [Gammaproteobacteria bacterium]